MQTPFISSLFDWKLFILYKLFSRQHQYIINMWLLMLSWPWAILGSKFWIIAIVKIIQNLHPIKAHGHDNISSHMLKICGSSIYKLLKMILKQYIGTGILISEWKKRLYYYIKFLFVCLHFMLQKQYAETSSHTSWQFFSLVNLNHALAAHKIQRKVV